MGCASSRRQGRLGGRRCGGLGRLIHSVDVLENFVVVIGNVYGEVSHQLLYLGKAMRSTTPSLL